MTSTDIDKKIITALERLSRIFRILLWNMSTKEGLSPTQIHILLYLNSSSSESSRVGLLAKEFGVTKATISGAIKSLLNKGYIEKKMSGNDKRVYLLQLTSSGNALVKRLLSWDDAFNSRLRQFPFRNKETVLLFLMQLIGSMREMGIIDIARVCTSCAHFQKSSHRTNGMFYRCNLTGKENPISDLNFDCRSYIYKDSIQRRAYA